MTFEEYLRDLEHAQAHRWTESWADRQTDKQNEQTLFNFIGKG